MFDAINRLVLCVLAAFALMLQLATHALAEAEQQPYKTVSFYFAGHEDDWQLFMNPPAFDDISDDNEKVIFVHMTAGDAGLGTGSDGRKHPYYLARENGARIAIRFMADAGKRPADDAESMIVLNGHAIFRVAYRNTVAYFFRLPDGYGAGTGYKTTGFQSLERLARGDMKTITAVDGSASYNGWDDLVATMHALYAYERQGIDSIKINVPELDEKLNPGDHSDHRHTARVALDAAKDLACARRFHYRDYAITHLPENMTWQEKEKQLAVFGATVAGILAFDHESEWAPHYFPFLGRSYYRVEEPSGSCN